MSQPIGVFDSGVGGLSVWREIVHELPHEDVLYVADQAHIPYGPRPLEEIRRFAEEITRALLARGAKLIVVACNAASGAALHHLRGVFPETPIVGMEPALKPAVEHTRSGVVGVIATPVTFEGDLFQQIRERFADKATLHTQACPGLVEAVESGALATAETRALLQQYVQPMLDAGADQLVLGCTHYPFLGPTLQEIVGPAVTLIDPAPAVARQVRRLLEQRNALNAGELPGMQHFYTSGAPAQLANQAARLVGYAGDVCAALWGDDGQLHLQSG